MIKDKYINQEKQQHWTSASLWLDINGNAGKRDAVNVKYANAAAWASIHSWNPRSVSLSSCLECEIGDVEYNIIKQCDCDLTMMRLASALSGIHLDLSELTIKPA